MERRHADRKDHRGPTSPPGSAGVVDPIASARFSDDRFVTAVRNAGKLEVISWSLSSDGFKRHDSTKSDAIHDNRLAAVSMGPDVADGMELSPDQVGCGAIDDHGHKIKLVLWDVSSASKFFPTVVQAFDYSGTHMTLSALEPFKSFDHLVIAVRDLDGRLSLTYYEAYW